MVGLTSTAAARSAAEEAALKAGVQIVELDGSDMSSLGSIIESVWGIEQVPQQTLVQGMAHAGNVILAAFKGEEAVGFSIGYLGWDDGLHMHSHMTATTKNSRSIGVGFALKMYQRAICLENNVNEIRWTYDPLIARNANFNLRKLGATVKSFLPDFYKIMTDNVNAGDRTDRFEVSWDLNSERTLLALRGKSKILVGTVAEVTIQSDFESLRSANFGQALQERERVRNLFYSYFAEGYSVDWEPDGKYAFSPVSTQNSH